MDVTARVFSFPYTVEQDEDGAWCASALFRLGVGAFGDGPTREAAIADLREGLELLLDEVGIGEVARRIDYYDDPAAPESNSLVPSVNVVVVNDAGEVLMIRRSDNDNWAVPGGAIDLGESMVEAAIRETREESGIECRITGIVGIYTDPRHVILYTSNGEARQEFSIVLAASAVSGTPTPSDESSEVTWAAREDLGSYSMDRSMRVRIGH